MAKGREDPSTQSAGSTPQCVEDSGLQALPPDSLWKCRFASSGGRMVQYGLKRDQSVAGDFVQQILAVTAQVAPL